MQIRQRQLAPQEIDHELIWLLVSLGGFAGLAACLSAHLPMPRCIFHSLTGVPCVTCGATRSAWQFLQGHFWAALLFNPLAFLAYCGVLVFDFYALIILIGRRPRLRLEPLTQAEKSLARYLVIALLAANWIYLIAAHRV